MVHQQFGPFGQEKSFATRASIAEVAPAALAEEVQYGLICRSRKRDPSFFRRPGARRCPASFVCVCVCVFAPSLPNAIRELKRLL